MVYSIYVVWPCMLMCIPSWCMYMFVYCMYILCVYIPCMYMFVYCMYIVHYLWIHSMKAVFWHIKWTISATHDAPAQIWLICHTWLPYTDLTFHTPKGSQGTINNMSKQYMIQLCRGPTTAWLCPLVSFVWKSQLVLQVLSNPLCQFGWQPTQDRMSSHSCISTQITLEVWCPLGRDNEGAGSSAFWWAWEDWCQEAHNQSIFLSWPAKHTMLGGYTCTYKYVTCKNMYIYLCDRAAALPWVLASIQLPCWFFHEPSCFSIMLAADHDTAAVPAAMCCAVATACS